MLVSVVVPIYGVERYIERSLHSLFSQTMASGVEYILVNDCTLDSSMEIAREVITHYPTITTTIVEMEVNGGVAAARQAGVQRATAEYVLHFDPDDWCEPTMVEDMYRSALNNNADVVICDFMVEWPDRVIYIKQEVAQSAKECIGDLLRGRLHGALWNKLIRRSLYTDNNIEFTKGVNYMEDMLICSKLLYYAQRVAYLPKASLYYIQSQSSMVASLSPTKLQNAIDVVQGIDSFLRTKADYEDFTPALNQRRAILKYFLLRYCPKAKRKEYSRLFGRLESYSGLSSISKVALWLGERRCFMLFNLVVWAGNALKRVKGKVKRY